jgi:tol-pal system protein YbgF
MKKRYLTPFILIGLMPLLSNCASQKDVQNLNYHVRTINKKLEDMKVNTVDQMQQRQASSSGQLDQLQSDILQLKSKLEENAHMNRMLQEQNKELQLAIQNLNLQQEEKINTKMAELDSKINSQKESLAAMQLARVQEAERRSKAAKKAADDAMRRAQQASLAKAATSSRAGSVTHLSPTSKKILFSKTNTPVKNTTKATTTSTPTGGANIVKSVPAPTPVVKETPNTLAIAQQQFSDGNYKKAYDLFEKNISRSSSTTTSIGARYMMGECLFKLGAFDQAIIQYQQIISNYPGNPQAAKALLRQGESFEQLSDTETARIIYRKITASYSSSPEAETARQKINSL